LSALRETPLASTHRALGARMVEFGGFLMPVQYTGILDEHAAVRERGGLFDVSHMGEIHLAGEGALAAAERLVTCPVASLEIGAVRYGCLCNDEGGTVDDVTVYRLAEDALFFCVNASNIEKDFHWIRERAGDPARVRVENRSDRFGLIALQGPISQAVLERLTALPLAGLRRFRFLEGKIAGFDVLASRTGYTGSDGFELYVSATEVVALWDALLEAGRPLGLQPAGLGARDTLRLEAALPLYGHELDDATSPLEAGLARFVKLDAGGFIGCDAIRARLARGHTRALAGFVLEDPGVARAGYPLVHQGREVGHVTSGAPSPTLGKSIGLGWLPPALAAKGFAIAVRVRGRDLRARVVETPFVRKVRGSPALRR
jgi:aminomethyltransferase